MLSPKQNTRMQLLKSSVEHLLHYQTTVTLTHPPRLKLLLASVAPKIQTSSEMLKFPARESYYFTLIVLALIRQETIKNNNTEHYLFFSNSGRFS